MSLRRRVAGRGSKENWARARILEDGRQKIPKFPILWRLEGLGDLPPDVWIAESGCGARLRKNGMRKIDGGSLLRSRFLGFLAGYGTCPRFMGRVTGARGDVLGKWNEEMDAAMRRLGD